MSILESDIERRCREIAEDNTCKLLKIKGVRGWPDRLLLCPNGRSMFLEFKRPGEKPSVLQEHMLAQLRKLNFKADWVDSTDQFIAILAYMTSLKPVTF